jgi:2-phosphoglycolate phosphatase
MSVLFDLDGTLLDTAPDFIAAIKQLRVEEAFPPLSQIQLNRLRTAVSHGISALVEIGFELSPAQPEHSLLCKRLLELYQTYLGQYTKPFPGIEDLLQTLEQKKIPWGIVTNKYSWLTEPLLAQQKLKNRAACIVSGDTTPYTKPHPEPLLFACQQIGISPEQCIYVGDAERDIVAGKAAGMTTITALFGYIEDIESAKQWPAHHYIYHADEILPWYEQWSQSHL